MNSREHDVPISPPQNLCHQEVLPTKSGDRHARKAGESLFKLRYEQAQAGDEEALLFLHEQLCCQNVAVLILVDEQAGYGEEAARALLQSYYLSLLLDVRAGNEDAAILLSGQIVKSHGVAHELLVELSGHGDQIARHILHRGYDTLLQDALGWTVVLGTRAFFHEQLLRKNMLVLSFLSERAAQDTRIATTFLKPYYQSLLTQAMKHDWALTIFYEQLQRKDEVIQAFLAQQVEERNEDALEVLWKCYRSEIYQYIKKFVKDEPLADDLIGRTFFKVWKSLPTRNKERKMDFRAWLYKVAYSVIIDYFREEKQEPPSPPHNMREGASIVKAGEKVVGCEVDCVRIALKRLSERARERILMADVEGYSTQEIAMAQRITQSSVTSHLSRDRARLGRYYLQAVNEKYSGTKRQQPSAHHEGRFRGKKQTAGKQPGNERGESHARER